MEGAGHPSEYRGISVPGIEDLVKDEAVRLFPEASPRPEPYPAVPIPGQYLWSLPANLTAEEVRIRVSAMHTISDFVRHHGTFRLLPTDPVAGMASAFRTADWLDFMKPGETFRVSCYRAGSHAFKSPDVERAVGRVIQERSGLRVSLHEHDHDIRIDIADQTWLAGVQINRDRIDLRFPRIYHPRISLRTPVAYALVRLATDRSRIDSPRSFVDPFCGSGIIPMEIASLFPDARVFACDRESEAVEGARKNIRAAGMDGRVEVALLDARDIPDARGPGSVDCIVTDPPFGVRLGRNIDYYHLYRGLLENARSLLRDHGRLSLLVARNRHLFKRALAHVGCFRVVHARVLNLAGLHPLLFVIEKGDC